MRELQFQKAVGAAIRRKRESLELSQEAFADSIEMHRAYYSSIERGERNLTLKLLYRVAQGLKAKISELMKDAGV
jgi:transcriptional regulator with XRE-family HTH domain